MSALSSTSTDAQVRAAYDDNASYLEDLSVSKCRAFITAARILLRRTYSKEGDQGSTLETNLQLIQKELDAALCWLAANGTVNVESGRSDFTRGRAL